MNGSLDLGIDRVDRVDFDVTQHLSRLLVKLVDRDGLPLANVMVPMTDGDWLKLLRVASAQVSKITDPETFDLLHDVLVALAEGDEKVTS